MGRMGRFLPGCVQQSSSQPPSPSSDFLTLVGSAASSYLCSAIERIAIVRHGASGSRAGGECKNKHRKKKVRLLQRATGTLPFPQKKKPFLCGGKAAKITRGTKGNLLLDC